MLDPSPDTQHVSSGLPLAIPPEQQVAGELVGREAELDTLQGALWRARRSPLQLIWISGDAGVGKTALAAQLLEPAQQAGGGYTLGKCEQVGSDGLLQAPRRALAQLLGALVAGPAEARGVVAEKLCSALTPDGGALLPLLPELESLTGPLPAPTPLEPYEQPLRFVSLFTILLRVLAQQVKPLVLVLDDLQWADSLTLEWIAGLVDDPELPGLVLLGLFRTSAAIPGSGVAELLERAEAHPVPPLHLALANLTSEQVDGLLSRRLQSEARTLVQLRDAIARSSGGNPFFVHQLLNALQREGLLIEQAQGRWWWSQEQLQARLASSDVVAFLIGCLDQLPAANLEVLECLACLGSQANLALLAVASGLQPAQLAELLTPALGQGLLVCSPLEGLASADPHTVVGFGHDRLQQAVAHFGDHSHRTGLQLAMARRLLAAQQPALAAQQFAETTDLLQAPAERQRVAALLQQAGKEALELGSLPAAERFLQGALSLQSADAWQQDPHTSFALKRDLHQLAYCLADYDRVDAWFGDLQRQACSPQQLLEPAAIQVMALSNRCRYQKAVDLVAELLAPLGLAIPLNHPQQAMEAELAAFAAAVSRGGLERLPPLPTRSPAGGSLPKLLNRLVPAAFSCNPPLACWLVLHSSRQWLAGDAHPTRLYPLACTLLASVPARGDYAMGYRAARTALSLGEASPYGLETARSRHVFSLFCQHWFEPLEQALAQARRAHQELHRSGELEFACYTFYTTQAAVLECAQQLGELAEENSRALKVARQCCNRHAEPAFLAYATLLSALRDSDPEAGQQGVTEAELEAMEQANPMAACYHHGHRALAAALQSDGPALQRHAQAAVRLEPYITGFYPVALIHLCQGLALVDQLRQGLDVGAELEQHLLWLRERAADAPGNFGHLALLLQAERLAVEGQWLEALELYESALRDAIAHQRPWHAAFICERAGRCYLTAGLEQAGQRLLEQAYQRYGSWGADRKASALIEEFPFLRACIDTSREQVERLQASQDLGRLRTLPELIQATATLIAQLSGATDVHIVVLDGQGQWQLKGGLSPDGVLPSLRLEEAERQGLLPAAALRLSLQRLQPLVFHDALLDPRVSGDPFVAPLACCSLLVVPVLVQLRPVAMVIGVHRHQRGVFSAALAQSVGLLCGQLGVALENLQIQRSLEEQVEERGRALEQAYLREAHDKERRRQLLEQKLKTSLTAAAVVHEIQQPLAAILLKCRLVGQDLAARRDGEALAHLKQHLLSLSGDAEQMAATMERMRMLLRNVETTHSRIDLASTLDSVLLYLRSEIKAHHVQVGHGGLEQPCMIQGDGAQLQTAVVNLIRNAIQAMEAQSASSRQLVVELERTPGQLRVVVADSGPGFPEDVANGGSWEVPRSTKSTGMGLGLFLAQTAAANHHGDLLIGRSSQLGGAEVVIILPLSPAGHGAMA